MGGSAVFSVWFLPREAAAAASPRWVGSLSVSLPWASGGGRGAAGVWALRQRHISLISERPTWPEAVNHR